MIESVVCARLSSFLESAAELNPVAVAFDVMIAEPAWFDVAIKFKAEKEVVAVELKMTALLLPRLKLTG